MPFERSNVTLTLNQGDNRRSDMAVRAAIEDIQKFLFDPQATSKLYSILLQHISLVTESEQCVCFLANENGTKEIDSPAPGSLVAVRPEGQNLFINQTRVEEWLRLKILPLRPVFFNGEIPDGYQTLLMNPDRRRSLLVVPIINRDKLQAVCFMAKREGNYSGAQIKRLTPMIGAVLCTLRSANAVKSSMQGFESKLNDNRYVSSLLATSPTAVLVVSPKNRILLANPRACEVLCPNNDCEMLEGKDISTFFPDYENLFKWSMQRKKLDELSKENQDANSRFWEDHVAKRIDGSNFIANISVFRYTHGSERYTTLQVQDLTDYRENAEESQRASEQFNALTHLVPVGILRVDKHWNCVYANDKWYDLTGLTNVESEGPNWINAIHHDDVRPLLDDLHASLNLGNDYKKEIRLVTPLGKVYWVELNVRVLFDQLGKVIGFLGTFQDITERLVYQEKLRHVAEYDTLTGLVNRSLFEDRLEQAFYHSQREENDITVFFLDLDGFKDVNDTQGHDIGDLLLQKVAERLLNILRRSDTVARFGGDEFVVLLGHQSDEQPTHVAGKIIDAISEPYLLENQDVFITVSLGIASGNYLNSSPRQILKQADAALYSAKAEGKNNFQLFDEGLNREAQQRVMLGNQLRYAIVNDRYELLFQPQGDIKTNNIVGFESLLRFKDESGDIVGADEFIPILEDTGMVVEAGEWVIEETCKQLATWQNSGCFPDGGFVSFNVSPRQLLDESIVDVIKRACDKHSIKPEQLVLEITESVIINKPQKVEAILMRLKDIGVRFAMDDFGTGYSSLTYLQRLPFDHLKIDRSFVTKLLTNKNDAKITRAIISLAQSLGLKVTAEGIEDEDVLSAVAEFGADHYQGFLLGRPLSAQEATAAIMRQMKP